jgi:hypothetical protein
MLKEACFFDLPVKVPEKEQKEVPFRTLQRRFL